MKYPLIAVAMFLTSCQAHQPSGTLFQPVPPQQQRLNALYENYREACIVRVKAQQPTKMVTNCTGDAWQEGIYSQNTRCETESEPVRMNKWEFREMLDNCDAEAKQAVHQIQ